MITLLALVLFLIFLFISLMHFYWGFGGRFGSQAVFPTKDDTVKTNMPGPMPTFIVAGGMFAIALFILIKSGMLTISIPSWINQYGLCILAGIFSIRAIGDFYYIGFFKKIKHTNFGRNDTTYYSPLCLLIAVLTVVLELLTK